jgi:hypothetical protein
MPNKYRDVPWKRNLTKIPSAILQQVQSFRTDIFFVGVTKTLTPEQVNEDPLRLLKISNVEGSLSETIPSETMGKYSGRNRNGWEVVRRDLPMITTTFYWETPNFGDAARNGTHTHYHDREVYQREFHPPRRYAIIAQTLKANPAGGYAVHFRIKEELSRTVPGSEDQLLFMLNLLQENCGSTDVISSETPVSDYIKTLALDWEIFPPGTVTEVVQRLSTGARTVSSATRGQLEERIRLFSRLNPMSYLKGTGGFDSYIGAKYADDLVVFENVQYGNALYILYDNWEDISKRSRIDLIQGTDANFDRLPHRIGWEEAFDKILRREKRKRKLS